MNVLAVIPARGGSKGIPRKNLKLLAGKPLLAHSILHAKQTPSITRIVVSTDDDEIADVARQWGAEVVHRPTEISGDKASSESALLHTLDWLRANENYEPDLVVFLQATSPCRQPGEIQPAIDMLQRDGADSLLSVGPVHGFVWRVEKDGATRSFSYDHLHRPRRQDAPEDLIENGSFYIFKPWVLLQFNNRLGGKIALYRMSVLDSFQIDEPGDFELLEVIMRYRDTQQKEKAESRTGPLSVVNSQWSQIKLLVLDFDGVLTDNRVLVSEDGTEAVACSREDGLGLEMLRQVGKVQVVVISKEKNPVVPARCRKLNIPCIHACDNKLATLRQLAADPSSILKDVAPASSSPAFCFPLPAFKSEEIAYVGNDVNDLECLQWAGLPIAVADATPEVLAAAKYVTRKSGGQGAIREICDALVKT
jgi:CMP-N-acetylneuraminic acid synthetase/3-deoxy-D-manno-octulosonate 8-phosphate phosphatase KdsC-like HAD superfamily phosphatase